MTLLEAPPVKEFVLCPPQRILVAEDDPAISFLIIKLLEHNWFYTVSKCNGADAASAFDPKNIDLLITDLRMEGGNGIELIKNVRAVSQTPIIIVTAFAAEYANEVRFLDNVAVIHKPFDARTLLRAVDKALPLSPPSFEPVLQEYDPDPVIAVLPTPTPPSPLPTPTKSKVLIADDDPEYLLMLSIMLRNAGYQVISSESVHHAVQLAVEQSPDLLLLDIHMGQDDGYAIQEKLEKFTHLANIPVVYITGDQSNWTQFTITAMGAHALIRKPFDREKLLAIIARVLT